MSAYSSTSSRPADDGAAPMEIGSLSALQWRDGGAQLSSRMSECARGDRRALEILYSALAAGIQRRLVRMLRDVALAEDVLQETFIAVWRHAHKFDPEMGLPVTWIWAIARNRALSALQRRRRECPLDDVDGFEDWPDLGPTPYDSTLLDEEAVVMRRCLETLKPVERQCIELAFFQGLSYSEVSVRLGRPLGSVKTTFRKSLACLRQCMKREMSVFALPVAKGRPAASMAGERHWA